MVHIIKSQNLASLKGKKLPKNQKPQKLSTANPLRNYARAQNENMSDQQQQQQQPGIILAANRRVPIPNSKYDDAEDKEKEESRPKITKKARTPKAQKQSKTSTTVKMTTVSSETDTDAEKEDAEDKKLVQPSKILIPQDGQQPKKWRLADQRRTILSRTKTLFRFLGLGHMRGVGMDLPYRQRFQFLLELIYGDTFKPKAFWARHPDPDEFFYALFRVAKPDLPRTAFVGDVFELSAETLHNEVNALALGRLGVSSEQLLRLFQHNAAVEHPQEQGKEKGKWVRVVDSTLPAEVKTGAEGKTTLFVPTPTEETEYRPNIPNGWRPGPTRGKRDRGSKGHSGVFLTQQALKAVGENAPVISPGVNTKYMEQRRAFIANGKVDAPVTAATKKKDTNGKGKNAGSNTTITTSTAATTTTNTTTTAKGTKRPRSTKAGTQASKRGGGGGGGGSGMLDGLVAAALLSEMDNQKEEEEQKEKKAREKEEKQRANASKKETGEKQPKSKLEKLMLEHLKKETGDGSNIKNAKDEKARSNDENHNGNVKKSDQHALSKKEESASPNGGRGGGRGGAPLEEEDFDDAIPTLPLDDDDLDTWERFDAWRAPLEEDDADCRAKHRTDTDRIEDVYSMFDQVVNDLRSPPSSQQQHQLTNNQTVLRDATSRAQKLLGIEYVLKGMSGDLEQCLDDDETLHMAKHHLAKISEIISRKMNQQLG